MHSIEANLPAQDVKFSSEVGHAVSKECLTVDKHGIWGIARYRYEDMKWVDEDAATVPDVTHYSVVELPYGHPAKR